MPINPRNWGKKRLLWQTTGESKLEVTGEGIVLAPIWNHNGSMSSLTIKDIPDSLLVRLRGQAKEHRRSVNQEVIVLLESALDDDFRTDHEIAAQVSAWRSIADAGGRDIDWDVSAIAAARTSGRTISD